MESRFLSTAGYFTKGFFKNTYETTFLVFMLAALDIARGQEYGLQTAQKHKAEFAISNSAGGGACIKTTFPIS